MRWLVAASIALAIGVGVFLFDYTRAPSLGEAVMVLVDQAEHALVPKTPIVLREIRAALKPVGVGLNEELGVVTFANPCVVRGKLAGHIVMQGAQAAISILLLPHETVRGRTTVERADLKAVLLPMKQGTIAILGAPDEELADIENKVLSVFNWRA